jgi:two-component system CheB/CheR fusion protein
MEDLLARAGRYSLTHRDATEGTLRMTKKQQDRRRPPKEARTTPDPAVGSADEPEPPDDGASFPIVGVGASAGGLEAFTQLLKSLPLDTGMGFVLIQHLDPEHESALTQILARTTSLPVAEITDNQAVEPNHIHVIPRGASLSIAQGILKLAPRPKTRAPHRPIDAFFESLAQDQRDRAIGVILSGTASDGTLGLEAIKAEGGITFAQDGSAKHDSMPRSAVAAGCVDLVLSPAQIAEELARIAKHSYTAGQPSAREAAAAEEDRGDATAHEDDSPPLPSGRATRRAIIGSAPLGAAEGYKKILLLLRQHSGVDFSLYKSTTIQRRIDRRVILTKHDRLAEYAGFLCGNTRELDALYSDVLISVTSFFRTPEMFEALKQTVYPQLLEQRGDGPLRCWVLGCSTGQEAYSIAMSFVQAAENAPRMRNLQIFATDLNEALLDKARHGLYATSLAEEIPPEQLRRFFIQEAGGYRVSKALREMVVFARQNLIDDPPFSRMDLISCRNLLIYLEPSSQKKAMTTFHYALKPPGFLLLGASESIGSFTNLFEPVDKKYKIYSRKPAPTSASHSPVGRTPSETSRRQPPPMRPVDALEPPESLHGELAAQREADRITVNQFAPPSVLVNADLQILQFRGPTGAYLQPPAGKASFDVLKMAREGLMLPLRAAINQAKQDNKIARKAGVRVKQNGKTRAVDLEVIPLKNLRERYFLILFEAAEKPARTGSRALSAVQPPAPPLSKKQEQSRVAELETDLAEMREYLESLQEQHEVANEELQAANEEVQSANEELQSINEELETSKEELESANEELITVNEEMSNRNLELNQLNNDLINLQASSQLAIVLLGRSLIIRRFTPQAGKQFELLATDVGRPIGHVRHTLVRAPSTHADSQSALGSVESPADLPQIAADVIASLREQQCEVHDREDHWYSLRARPYMTLDNKVDGAVLVLVDIDVLKQGEQVLAEARDYAESTLATVREPLLVLDGELRVQTANRSYYRTFSVASGETLGRFIYELGNRQWNIPHLRERLEDVLLQNTTIEDFQIRHESESIGTKTMLLNARRIVGPQQSSGRILVAIEDITERMRAQQATARLAAIVASSDDAIISKDLDGVIDSWNLGAEKLFGYAAEEIIGKPVTVLIPEDHADEEPRILERIRSGKLIKHYETVRQRKDGTLIDISLTVSPLRDAAGRIIGASKIAHDITEHKRAQEALRQSHARLQSHTEELSRFNHVAVGRELRMIELKKEINELCRLHGEPARFTLEFEQDGTGSDGVIPSRVAES